MKYSLILTIMGCFMLSACGGGGGNDSPSSPSTGPNEADVQPNQTLDEVQVPDEFSYDPLTDYELDLNIGHINSERAFVSVYTGYSERDGQTRPDYASRVVATPMQNGVLNLPFSAANAGENLLVEIWFYSNADPIQKLHPTQQAVIEW